MRNLKQKQDQINQTPNATQEEKNEALTKLTQAKDAVLQTISNSQSNDNVDQAQTNGIQTLDGINTTVNKNLKQKKVLIMSLKIIIMKLT